MNHSLTFKCDGCDKVVPIEQAHTLLAQMCSANEEIDGVESAGRVNMLRAWSFCSDECKAKWFAASSVEPLFPTTTTERVAAAQTEIAERGIDYVPGDPEHVRLQLEVGATSAIVDDDGSGDGPVLVQILEKTPSTSLASTREEIFDHAGEANAWWQAPEGV